LPNEHLFFLWACDRSTSRRDIIPAAGLGIGDSKHGLQRLIRLVHETYLVFVANGIYRDCISGKLGACFEVG